MKKKYLLLSLFLIPAITGCTNNISINELGDIIASKDVLVQGESIQLNVDAPKEIEIKWSVSNDLASVSEDGLLTASNRDGSFIVTASYGSNNELSASKLFKIYTLNVKDLTSMLFNAGSLYNYTVSWNGELLNAKNEVVDKNYIKANEITDGNNDPVGLYEDLVEKGNIYKAEVDGYYCKYGSDSMGNEYEGGGYNSPDGFVHNYDIINGKFVEQGVDEFLSSFGVSDYKEGYTGDLSKFVDDEFKVEDSNLKLSDDKTYFIYDSKVDTNDYKGLNAYAIDYSIPEAVFNTVDGGYANSFYNSGLFNDLKGKISYTKTEIDMEFDFVNIAISDTNNLYTYKAKFKIYDIGSTVIEGLKEQIEKDKENLK